jgi:hypothetical protein
LTELSTPTYIPTSWYVYENKNTPSERSSHRRCHRVDSIPRLQRNDGGSICQAAELTKGSFFHYFKNKEVLGIAALETWGAYGKTIYAEAWDDDSNRPLEALYRFIEIMTELSMRPEAPCRCVVGTISQEMAQTNEGLRDACSLQLSIWTEIDRSTNKTS